RVDVEPALADRLAEALDDDPRLACPRSRGDEDDAALLDRALLLDVHRRKMLCTFRRAGLSHRSARETTRNRVHERLTRHIGHRSHHCGQEPRFGSWRTS